MAGAITFAPYRRAGLADADLRLARIAGGAQSGRVEAARNAATRAVALDGENAEAHEVLGLVLFNDWDFPGAAREFGRAVAADPLRVPAAVAYSRALLLSAEPVTA